MPKILKQSQCRYCRSPSRTTANYGDTYAVRISRGRWVHYGCLIHWLLDDAIARNFPGLEPRERTVLKYRIGAPEPHGPNLVDLNVVGRRLGWSGSGRASQVQLSAMSKFDPNYSDAAEVNATKWTEAQDALSKLHALFAEADDMLNSLLGEATEAEDLT
jgi:hypothetical protein